MNGTTTNLKRAEAILYDHAHGLHDIEDHPDGCRHEGCEDAFWLIARSVEHEAPKP